MKRFIKSLFIIISFVLLSVELNAQWVQTIAPKGAVYSFAFNNTNIFASSVGEGVLRSSDNGINWTVVDSGLTTKIVYHVAISGSYLFAGTPDSGAYRSSDNGTIWIHLDSGISATADVRSFASNQAGIFAGTGSGVLLSTDNGISWNATGSGPGGTIFSLVFNGSNLFAGTMSGVFLSTNNGSNWTAIDSGLTSKDVRFLAASGSNLFVCTPDSGVFRSTDNGTSWLAVNNGITNLSLNAFAVNGTNLFAGGADGVFLSSDNGTNWTAVNTGLTTTFVPPKYYVGSLAVIGTNLFAGDFGIWRRPLSDMITGIENKQNNLPTSSSLEQNYPNPFNPSTTINYSVPKESLVTIKVYDVLGSEVETLVNEQKNPGNYNITFNAGKLASGVYFYQLRSSNYTSIKKMIFLK